MPTLLAVLAFVAAAVLGVSLVRWRIRRRKSPFGIYLAYAVLFTLISFWFSGTNPQLSLWAVGTNLAMCLVGMIFMSQGKPNRI